MGRHKQTDTSQGNTMELYSTPVPLPQSPDRSEVSGDDMTVPMNPEEPSRAELLAPIQGSRVGLEGKTETVAVEVNLLRADLWKVSDKVKVAEGSIVELQTEEVWRWLEMWDKVAPGRKEGTGGVALRASGVESPDWRSCEAGRLVDAVTGGSAMDSNHRVETQQDGTMAVVSSGQAGGMVVERGLGAGGSCASLTMIFMVQGADAPLFCRVGDNDESISLVESCKANLVQVLMGSCLRIGLH
ncbi:hypothetical protein NDU88_007675 [Pleurodeles waltl]|uniref:Uncharacterized protein n=1 Tax=Pleurodeles waltl TaxID=8319 RepID=A0AAV7NTU0_PLEWA|nr:hypothetical protein NDU88_007675 [Pleurodeles waltl]